VTAQGEDFSFACRVALARVAWQHSRNETPGVGHPSTGRPLATGVRNGGYARSRCRRRAGHPADPPHPMRLPRHRSRPVRRAAEGGAAGGARGGSRAPRPLPDAPLTHPHLPGSTPPAPSKESSRLSPSSATTEAGVGGRTLAFPDRRPDPRGHGPQARRRGRRREHPPGLRARPLAPTPATTARTVAPGNHHPTAQARESGCPTSDRSGSVGARLSEPSARRLKVTGSLALFRLPARRIGTVGRVRARGVVPDRSERDPRRRR